MRLFDRKNSSKKKTKCASISQSVSIKNDSVTRKCVTPGEPGKYLIKLEVTDCDDLKGIRTTQYWTKVWKKVIFLVDDEKDPTYIAINNIWGNQSKRILKINDSKVTEFEDDEEKDSRKRTRYR